MSKIREQVRKLCWDHDGYLHTVGGECPNCWPVEQAMCDAEKQARAEVLATQREYLDRYQKFTELPEEVWPYVEQVNKIVTEIRTLMLEVQPAAFHLEALLREAELKGLRLDHIQHGIIDNSCRRCRRIAELEKARAILEKK